MASVGTFSFRVVRNAAQIVVPSSARFVHTASRVPARPISTSQQHLLANKRRWQPFLHRTSVQYGQQYIALRQYASRGGPTQHQVMETFGTPFMAFFGIISRIARIVAITGTTIVLSGALILEGSHFYVEHVAMPRSYVHAPLLEQASAQGQDDDQDAWGWEQEFSDEAWSSGKHKGTDPRLGWRGRHLVRAAWMNANWGGGLLISTLFSPSSHAHLFGRPGKSGQVHEDEGLESATAYLNAALRVAEEKGIRLPDMAAIRAGVASPQTSKVRASDNAIDETAVALETKLASLLEKRGDTAAVRDAIAGYTRIFDALSSLNATNYAMKSVGRSSGQPNVRADRLVRLATRIGNAHASLGNRDQAEGWLLHAVGIAGTGASFESGDDHPSRAGIFRNSVLSQGDADKGPKGGIQAAPLPETNEAQSALAHSSSSQLPVKGAPIAPTETPPSPALTRSLISALLGLSAASAQPNDRSQLEKALQFQAGALRLIRVELARLALSNQGSSTNKASADKTGPNVLPLPAQLHSLWLAQHDGLASVHVAETMYALGGGPAAKVSSAVRSMLSAIGLGGSSNDGNTSQGKLPSTSSSAREQTDAWLAEAQTRAVSVRMALGQKGEGKKNASKTAVLDDKWAKAPLPLSVPATRLLRDSIRLGDATTDMQTILGASGTSKAGRKA